MRRRLRRELRFALQIMTGTLLPREKLIARNERDAHYLQHGPCTNCWCWPCWCGNKPVLDTNYD